MPKSDSIRTVERLDANGYVDIEICWDFGDAEVRLATFKEVGQPYNTAQLSSYDIDTLIAMLRRAKRRLKKMEGEQMK